MEWILRQESIGYLLTYSQVRACMTALLKSLGVDKPLGQHWISRFVARHPEVKKRWGDVKRPPDLMVSHLKRSNGT